MSGRLGLASPWARQAVSREMRAALEAEIPDGVTVGISGHAHAGGHAFLVWVSGTDPRIEARGVRDIPWGVRTVLARLAAVGGSRE